MFGRHVGRLVARERVLVRDDGPAVFHRKLFLPGGHRRALRLERIDQTALTDPPEPVVPAHLINHPRITEVRWLEGQTRRRGSFSVAGIAVTDRAASRVDRFATREHGGVCPGRRGNMGTSILRRYLRVDM